MLSLAASLDVAWIAQGFAALCQVSTAVIAATIGVVTYRYTKRQSALALISQNNALANLVNSTVIQSETARSAFGRLQEPIVGAPDDAVLFMYLNYVHNTYRMRQIGAVSQQVWLDTLRSCGLMVGKLRRDQVVRLLSRGYERGFQLDVLARFDAGAKALPAGVATLRTRERPSAVALAS